MIFILDTTALLSWLIPSGTNITCSQVLEEVKNDFTHTVIEGYISSGKIQLENPDEKHISEAENIAKDTGDYIKLSETDICIIALALKYYEDKEVTVITDDYAIQNILRRKGIKFQGYYRKIKDDVDWMLVCSYCGKIYPPTYTKKYCEECGGIVIRRRKR